MEEKRRSEDHEEEQGVLKRITAGNKSKRDEWSEAGILTLLDAYQSKWSLRNRAKLKGSDWEEIAFHVSSTSSLKNPNQCKNKIESMKKKYRLESNSSSRTCSSWPFYARMHQLLYPFKSEDGETNNHHIVVEGSNNHNNQSDDDDETAAAPPPPVVEKQEDEAVGDEKRRRKKKGRFEEESESGYMYLGESIRLVGRCIMKIEQGRIDMYRECEKMRLESEMKRAELDLQRTQIVASTQLQIANLFANTFLVNNNNNNNTAATQHQHQPSSLVHATATSTENKLA